MPLNNNDDKNTTMNSPQTVDKAADEIIETLDLEERVRIPELVIPDLFRYPGAFLDSRLRGNDEVEVFNRRSNITFKFKTDWLFLSIFSIT